MALFAYRHYLHKLLLLAPFLSALVLSNWFLAPYIWSPSIDEIDIKLVTKEVDALFSKCINEGYRNETLPVFIRVKPSISPYIYDLHTRGRDQEGFGIFCSDVIHIPMWNDWWSPSAGLHVVRDGGQFPLGFDRYMSNIGGRVYWWNNGGQSVWRNY